MSERPWLIVGQLGAARIAWLHKPPVIRGARLIFDLANGVKASGKADRNAITKMLGAASAIIEPAMREYVSRMVRPLLPVEEFA